MVSGLYFYGFRSILQRFQRDVLHQSKNETEERQWKDGGGKDINESERESPSHWRSSPWSVLRQQESSGISGSRRRQGRSSDRRLLRGF